MFANVAEAMYEATEVADTVDAVTLLATSALLDKVVKRVATVVAAIVVNLLVAAATVVVVAAVVVDEDNVGNSVLEKLIIVLVVGIAIDFTKVEMVEVVALITDGRAGINGYSGHISDRGIGCPSIFRSKMKPINDPAVRPTLYDRVIIFPAASLSVAGTFAGANIIGRLPAKPLVIPKAAVKMNAGVSPAIIGCERGAQHNNSNGTSAIRIVDSKMSWRRDQGYGNDAIICTE